MTDDDRTDTAPATRSGDQPDGDVTLMFDGPVSDEARAAAESAVDRLTRKAPRPIIFARIKIFDLEQHAEPEAVARGVLDVSGTLVRAEAAAPTPVEAVNLLVDRLDRQLRRLAERRQDARDRPPSTPDGQWRSGDLPDSRPDVYPRDMADRHVIRQETYAAKTSTVEEALFHLDVLDFRFLLFADAGDGVDSIVYESGDGVRLRRLDGSVPEVDIAAPVAIDETPAPSLTVAEAIRQLELSDTAFQFFRDVDDRHGSVIYRRYDGHYGLIEPR